MKYTIPHDMPLLEALVLMSPECSKTTLRSWLKDERVTIDGECVKLGQFPAKKGQKIEIGPRKRVIEGNMRIVYEDRYFVAIDKPYNLLSVSADYETSETAHYFLKEYYQKKVYVIHRLDFETSGVMLFAFTEEVYNKFKKMFEEHNLTRSYTAIVEGKVQNRQGTWKSYLYEDANYYVHSTDKPRDDAKIAITHYEVEGYYKDFTRLKLTLETGRKNQIRVHCQEAGHSVVGDVKYGAKTNPLKRLCLHAGLLEFMHPMTNKKMTFESPAPTAFNRLVRVDDA